MVLSMDVVEGRSLEKIVGAAFVSKVTLQFADLNVCVKDRVFITDGRFGPSWDRRRPSRPSVP